MDFININSPQFTIQIPESIHSILYSEAPFPVRESFAVQSGVLRSFCNANGLGSSASLYSCSCWAYINLFSLKMTVLKLFKLLEEFYITSLAMPLLVPLLKQVWNE